MNDDDIIIRFYPFIASHFPYWAAVDSYSLKVDGGKTMGAMSIDWCSLPDILFEKGTRRFIGLSFSIAKKYDKDVQAFVKTIGNDRCCYVAVNELHQNSRYQGLGEMNRLELYWEESSEAAICETASLDNGAWLFLSVGEGNNYVSAPFGYWFTMVAETKEDHQLR